MKEKNIDEIVIIEQLPKIRQQLEQLSVEVQNEIDHALSLDCTEESKNEVKKARATLNNICNELETKRKNVKEAIMQPYLEFETMYNELLKDKLKDADSQLKEKITNIEVEQKKVKEEELRRFANEHFIINNLQEFVSFEDIGLNITLSASEKSLKEQTIAFCEKVSNELELIKNEPFSDEIIIEYKETLDYIYSKMKVITRHRQLEELERKKEELEKQKEEEQKVIEKVEEIIEEEIVAPKEIIEEEDIITVQFTVTGSKEKIKQIKNLMIELGVEYQ